MSEDSPSERTRTPALEATRKTKRQATSAAAHVAPEPQGDDPLLGFAPYLHAAPRSNSITPERQRRFIATLAATGVVSTAARAIGKSMEALYKLRARPGAEGFAHAWDEALERGVQRLEDIAMERAAIGTPTPIVSGGKMLGTWDKPDNHLLRFLLQNRRPDTYRPNSGTGGGGSPARRTRMTQAEAIAADRRADEMLDEIDRKLDAMRRRWLEARWAARAEARDAARADRLSQMAPMCDAIVCAPVASMPAGDLAASPRQVLD
ncbi:hypothetical protein [Altererythrobacter sp. MTPC7]|uniref:hypothetical protein n=1 Tax=Altererythrobacter sp. MTPC7 TaxID=3056567 RepID=UPI0036F35C7E